MFSSVLFWFCFGSVLFFSFLFCSNLFCSVKVLFCSVLFYSVKVVGMKREIFPAVNKNPEPQAGKGKNPQTWFVGRKSLILKFEVGENTLVRQ